MKQEMTGWQWTTCRTFAHRSKQITMPAPHHSIFIGWMRFLTPNQQCQSTEGKRLVDWLEFNVPSQQKYGYIRDER